MKQNSQTFTWADPHKPHVCQQRFRGTPDDPHPAKGSLVLFVYFFLALIMSILRLELPSVLMRPLYIVDADVTQDFLQINL